MTLEKWKDLIKIENPVILVISYIIASIETKNFNQYAIGGVGELGYFQITPKWYPAINKSLSPEYQGKVFVDVLQEKLNIMNSYNIDASIENILRVWNGGAGNMFNPTTNKYVNKAKRLFNII